MLSQWKLVLFVFGAFIVAEGARRVGAQNGMNVNPSQTTPSQNPSQSTPNVNPSMTTPGQNAGPRTPGMNPSMTTPGQNPSQAVPALSLGVPEGLNGEVPSPARPDLPIGTDPTPAPGFAAPTTPQDPLRISDRRLGDKVRTSITQGPNAVSGVPAFGVGGIPIKDLRVLSADGKVILRGVARSADDRADAEARAAAIAGEANVVDELIVK
jgi:hypothetical protein